MHTNRIRNLRTENTIQLKILEKKRLAAQERKMKQRSGKNSCTSNQDQMFNAVQCQHINSFMLCRVVCVFLMLSLSGPCFLILDTKKCTPPPLMLTSSKFKSPTCSATYFKLFFFVFFFVLFNSIWAAQWPMQTYVGRKSEWKNAQKYTFLSHESSERPFHLLSHKWIRRENP